MLPNFETLKTSVKPKALTEVEYIAKLRIDF